MSGRSVRGELPGVRPRVVIIPALILLGGLVTFLVAPLDVKLRTAILASDVFAALLLGLILWRQGQG